MPRYGSKGDMAKEASRGGKKILPMVMWAAVWPVLMLLILPGPMGCVSNATDGICGTVPQAGIFRPLFDIMTFWQMYTWTQIVVFIWVGGLILITLFEGW